MKATIEKINNTPVVCFDDYFIIGNNLKANAIFFKSGHIHFIDINAFKDLFNKKGNK